MYMYNNAFFSLVLSEDNKSEGFEIKLGFSQYLYYNYRRFLWREFQRKKSRN